MSNSPESGPVDFSTHIVSIASSAMVSMGIVPAPTGETHPKDVQMARFLIDILAMLEEKTKGNLTANEAALLQRLLADLRMSFVSATK